MSPFLRRATALLLSWIFTATSVWAAGPPMVPVAVPLAMAMSPALLPVPSPASPEPLTTTTNTNTNDDPVRPILECVTEQGSGSYTAYFGYENENNGAVTIPLGTKNKFSPTPENRGQPTTFQPGRTSSYPNAAFSVAFNGSSLVWTLKGPDGSTRTSTASSSSNRCPAPAPSCDTTFFGPKKYTRTCDSSNVFTATVTVPSWVVGPFVLKVKNGGSDGKNRVSGGKIQIGSTVVAGSGDLKTSIGSFDKQVSLGASNSLKVTIEGAAGAYLTVSFCGQGKDKTPPQVTVSEPASGSVTTDQTPRIAIRYPDPKGPLDSGASGADTDTLKVTLDDVDRTSLLCKRPEDASGDVPTNLALLDGLHRIKAQIKDRAGNLGEALSEFRVDKTKPVVKVEAPTNGSYVGASALVRVSYADAGGLDVASLRIFINGVDRTPLFTKGPAEASATLTSANGLKTGANQVEARIKDLAGTEAVDAIGFTADLTPPRLVIAQPAAGARLGASEVELIVQYGDDQALDLPSFAATLDGAAIILSQGPEGAMGRATLADGSHTFTVRIKDKAGNVSTATTTFLVDASRPSLAILQPPPGMTIRDATPYVVVAYGDSAGIDTTTLKIRVNGVDRTSAFQIGPDTATWQIGDADRLPEGPNTITAEIKDLTANQTDTESSFTVDSVLPAISFASPDAITNTAAPLARVDYSDAGTGIDTTSVIVLVDGIDRTSLFAIGQDGASGTLLLDPALSQGEHELVARVKDAAGNEKEARRSFLLDSIVPEGAFVAPLADSFINDTTPVIRLAYSDPSPAGALVSGVDPASVRIFHHRGDEAEAEITGWFQRGAQEAVATVPEASALLDGTHHLRAVLRDKAGNGAAVIVAEFELDTVKPTYEVETPAHTAVVGTRTPAFLIHFQDDRGTTDTTKFAFRVDGVDLTSRLALGVGVASGTLLPADTLAEGEHAVTVRVVDRAGNEADPVPHLFTVDTTPPQAAVTLPADQAYLGTPQPLIQVTYSDSGPQGIDPASVHIFIDSVDHTDEFTVGPTSAQGTPVAPLADGAHTVRVEVRDWAQGPANPPAVAQSGFIVDQQPPQVVVDSPKDGDYVKASPVELAGTVVDADPEVAVECRVVGGATVPGLRTGPGPSSTFTCRLALTEGRNEIAVAAKDRLDHATSVTLAVILDTQAPQVTISEPTAGTWTGAETVTVVGRAEDQSPIRSVTVNGVDAILTGADFTAVVPVGDGSILARAEDVAGNAGTAGLSLQIDREAPVVHITSPTADWVRGPQVEVVGTVSDASPVRVEVNGQPESSYSEQIPREFRATVPASDGPLTLTAIGHDSANNVSVPDSRDVNVDSKPPVIEVTEPAGTFLTRETQIHVAGRVIDASPTTLDVSGHSAPVTGGQFAIDVPLASEGPVTIDLLARDSVQLEGTRRVEGFVDRTAPQVQVLSPEAHAVLSALPVVVQGLVSDEPVGAPGPLHVKVDGHEATVTGQAWAVTFESLPEGPHEFAIVAVDAAGNQSAPLLHPVTVALSAPSLEITFPSAANGGLLTREASTRVEGTVEGTGTITVTVNGVDVVASGGTFALAALALAEGENTITAVARNEAGRKSPPATVLVTRDSIPPTVELDTPETLGLSTPGEGVASASDNYPGVTLEVRVNNALVASGSSPLPFALVAPPGAKSGDALTVKATAEDKAGNSANVSREVPIVAGVLVGQVLDDLTGLALAEATVVLEGTAGPKTDTTDEKGQYSFPTGELVGRVRVNRDGMTEVERELAVRPGVGTLVLDARLTTLGAANVVGPDGFAFPKVRLPAPGAFDLLLRVPPDAVTGSTDVRLTPLSAQGLPGLLPLGWSPLVAFDVRAAGPVTGGLEATIEGLAGSTGSPSGSDPAPLSLARFDAGSRSWLLVQGEITPAASVTLSLSGPGAWALVAADSDPAPATPDIGASLTTLTALDLPATATSQGVVEPSVLPPTSKEAASGRLSVESGLLLPSGTVVQAQVTEEYELVSGKVASEEVRQQDILLFRAPVPLPTPGTPDGGTAGVLRAEFPIKPSRAYDTTELVQGKVHLDILAGREQVRGKVGGNQQLVLEAGGAIVSVPAASIAEDTAVSIEKVNELSAFLPTSASVEPVAEVVLDFAGATLATSAGLSVEGTADAGDTLLVARVDRLLGIPRLLVVALAEASSGRLAALPPTGPTAALAGIKESGRYVFFRVSGPVAWVTGSTTLATGAPVSAVVEGDGLPFIGRSRLGVPYLLAALAGSSGSVRATASVPGLPLQGSGVAEVSAAGPASAAALSLILEGAVTTATITPANGSLGVALTDQVELDATAPLKATAENLAKVVLRKGAEIVAVRYLVSGSGRRLAVIPAKPLDYSTSYSVTANGLLDAYGAPVSVSPVGFTTKDFVAPVYDLDAVVFSFPKDGIVTVTAPAGSLPPFAQVLIINSSNGAVLSLQVDGNGCIGCLEGNYNELPATTSDRLRVTITDPSGNVTTFERSKFVDTVTGLTAIGPGGGTVQGLGGVELRLPDGAVEQGVRLKVSLATPDEIKAAFTPAQLAKLLPGTHLGSVLKIESPDQPTFKKEVDLVFPVPDFTTGPEPRPENPKDAFYYVQKKVAGKDADGKPIVLFEVVDDAKVEGEGAKTRIVTASPPFPGLMGPLGGFVSFLAMSWSFDLGNLGKPLAGRIVGKVLIQEWDPEASTPSYRPLAGVAVSATDDGGTPLRTVDGGRIATTQGDGTYALWDDRYLGGTIKVVAEYKGETREAFAFESLGGDPFQPYPHDARANITFPATKPPAVPPVLEVLAFRVEDGERKPVNGISVVQTALHFGIKNNSKSTFVINGASINGEELSMQGPLTGDPWGLTYLMDGAYTPSKPGTYTFSTTALPATGAPMPVSWTFRVIAEGGGIVTDNESRPKVIPGRTLPKLNATGVSVGVFPEVAFTEPVRNIVGSIPPNVTLEDADGNTVAIQLSGVRPDLTVVDPLTSAEEQVTSLTIQPLTSLRFSTKYTLKLRAGILDLDTNQGAPAPKALEPYETSFTTFGPESLTKPGEGETFASPGIVVMQDRAYLATNNFVNGSLVGFSVEDPTAPERLEGSAFYAPRPVDLAGLEETSVSQGRLVVVATSSTNQLKPGSLLLYDVTSDQTFNWIGASTVVSSGMDGFISRVALKDNYAYVATVRQGIQIVDLQTAKAELAKLGANQFVARRGINTEGEGYGQSALVNTITIPKKVNQTHYYMGDIDVADMGGRTLAVVTGESGIAVADTGISSFLFPGSWPGVLKSTDGTATLGWSYQSALGRLSDKDIAVVVGTVNAPDGAHLALAVVDLANPSQPVLLGWADLQAAGFTPTDVILNGDTALVGMQNTGGGETMVFGLSNLTQPRLIGTISNIGGRLSLGANGILYGSAYSPFGGNSPLGGVRTAALSHLTYISSVKEDPVIVALNRKSIEKQTIKYRALFPPEEIETSDLEILNGQTRVLLMLAPLDSKGAGQIELPEGIQHPPVGSKLTARLVVNRDKPDAKRPPPKARALKNDMFTLEPSQPSLTSADDDPLTIAGLSQALLSRLQRDPGYAPPSLTWVLGGSSSGGGLTKTVEASPTGLYINEFLPATDRSAIKFVELKLGSAILAHTSLIQNSAGRSWTATFRAEPPPQSPGLVYPAGTGLVPADGTTVIQVALENIRDRFGNPVNDDSLVYWSAGDDGGRILTPETPILNSRAVMQYEAGTRPGTVIIRAELEQYRGAALKAMAIQQAALDVVVTRDGASYRADVNSAAGLPANGTIIEWETTLGAVSGPLGLDGGVGTATYEPPQGLGRTLPRFAFVFATVGRSHHGLAYDLQAGKPGPKFSSNTSVVSGGGPGAPSQMSTLRRDGAAALMSPEAAAASAGSATIHVEDGLPGETFRAVLGSTRFPAHLPFAIYPLDSVEGDKAPDTQGPLSAQLGSGVALDQTTSARGAASYQFTGQGGLALPDAPSLQFSGDFGINGHVRFDTVNAEQTIFERVGSYGLRLRLVAGQARLEFYVRSGGLERKVLSPQVVSTGVWYSFGAQLRGQRLHLSVGDSDLVQTGDEAPGVDPTEAPLVLGATLAGNLDQVEIFDFTAAPFVTFANGATEMDVTLDGEGQADLPVNVSAAGDQGATFASLDAGGTITYDFANGSRSVVIRRYEAPDPSQVQDESATHVFFMSAAERVAACIGGIATGEAGGMLGAACDFVAGFNPFLTVPLAIRDLVVKTKHFIEGKRSKLDYVVAAGALVIIVASAFPVVRSLIKGLQRGEQALKNTSAAVKIAAKEAQLVEEIAKAGTSGVSKEGLIRILDSEDDVLRAALIGIETGARDGAQTWDRLERLGKVFGHEELVQRLDGILTKFGRTPQTFARLEGMIEALDRLGLAIGQKLSLESLEGIMHLMERAPSVDVRRIVSIWQTIPAMAPAAEQARIFQNIFEWIRAGETAGISRLEGWSLFLQTGMGSISRTFPGSGTAKSALQGAYHSLEFLAKDLKFGSNIVGMEVLEAIGSRRRIDILVQEGANLVQYELKNIASFTSEHGGQVLKDIDRLEVLAGGKFTAESLRSALGDRLRYVLRGTKEESAAVATKLLDKIKEGVGADLAHVVDELKDTVVRYTGRRQPI